MSHARSGSLPPVNVVAEGKARAEWQCVRPA